MNQTYVVKRGDTLYGISNQFGVSVTELANLNNVKADSLKVGQTLIIPTKSGTNPDNMFIYTVKAGDTLYNIAKTYKTTVNDIINLNNLKNSSLTIGQKIRIPEMYFNMDTVDIPSYTNYVVKKGDSLYSISKKYNVSVDTIIEDNALKNNVLQVGQVLKIRLLEENEIIEECYGEDYDIPISNSYTEYVVKVNDNLYSIAKKFNTNVNEIMKVNNLTNTNLSIGQVLKIPSSSVPITYTVQRGDTLYSIAKKFNTNVDIIKQKNNLKSNSLSVGQILTI